MPAKLTFEYIKEFINKEQLLVSTEYTNNKQLLQILCNECEKTYEQNFDRYSRGYRHQKCSNTENGRRGGTATKTRKYGEMLKETKRQCIECKNDFTPSRTAQILCDQQCALKYSKSNTFRERSKINGSKGGLISAERQQRRSKNEICFADLCIQHFGENNVLCNERYFKDRHSKYWDTDVIIPHLKIAVAWNGLWHYKQLTKKHNLRQVQARDTIKADVINQNGFKLFVIKDTGGYNEAFVKEQFDLFIHKVSFTKVLDNLLLKFENSLKLL